MRRFLLQYAAPVLAIAVVVHLAVVVAVPHLVMHAVMRRFAAAMAGNAPVHVPPLDARERGVPLPSPDLLYSSCVLDVSRGPVVVSVTPGGAYLSVALFDMRSDNVFVTNDDVSGGKEISVVVAAPGQAVTPHAGQVVARLDGAQGLVLVRGLASTPELARISDQARRTLKCEALVTAN